MARGIMANQVVIDWFLELYDAGNEITPDVIKVLAKGLRARKKVAQVEK